MSMTERGAGTWGWGASRAAAGGCHNRLIWHPADGRSALRARRLVSADAGGRLRWLGDLLHHFGHLFVRHRLGNIRLGDDPAAAALRIHFRAALDGPLLRR